VRMKIVSFAFLAAIGAASSAHAAEAGQATAGTAPTKSSVAIPGQYDPVTGRFTQSVEKTPAAATSYNETITFTPVIAYDSRPAKDYSSVQCSISAQYNNNNSNGTASVYFAAGKKPTPISINVKFTSSSATNTITYTLMCSAYAILNEGHTWAALDNVVTAKNGALSVSRPIRF
jgi:hypothetical protein